MSGAPLMAFPLMAQTAIELRGYAGGNFQLGNLWIFKMPENSSFTKSCKRRTTNC